MEQVNPNILTDISYYSLRDHRAYPKPSYIKERTGFDIVSTVGSQEQARAVITAYTEDAFNLMMAGVPKYNVSAKSNQSERALTFLIAVDEDYRLAFLKYVCSYIFDIYRKADYDSAISEITIAHLRSGKLSHNFFPFTNTHDKVGY